MVQNYGENIYGSEKNLAKYYTESTTKGKLRAFAKLFRDLESLGKLPVKVIRNPYIALENMAVYENNDLKKFIIDYTKNLQEYPAQTEMEMNYG